MKKIVGRLLGVLLLVMVALAGCGTKNAGTADGGSAAAETKLDSVKSKVKFDGVYTAGDTLKIQMTLDKDGNCDYGYTGIYQHCPQKYLLHRMTARSYFLSSEYCTRRSSRSTVPSIP